MGLLIFEIFYASPIAGLLSIVFTFIFDSDELSIVIIGYKVRIFQIIIILYFLAILIRTIIWNRRIERYPLLIPSSAYLLANILASVNSPAQSNPLKIIFLLVVNFSIAFVFWYGIRDKKSLVKVIRSFALIGLGLMVFGIYDALWRSSEALYVRTAGTFNDPDLMGIIAAAFLIFGVGCEYFNLKLLPKMLTRLLILTTLLVLAIVAIRTTGIGLLVGFTIIFLFPFYIKIKKIRTIYLKKIAIILGISILTILVVSITLPEVTTFTIYRFTNIYEKYGVRYDSRWEMMEWAFQLFLQKPIIGNGPGSYSELGIIPGHWYLPSRPYNPSLLTTILSDTGVLGLGTFCWLALAYWSYTRRGLQQKIASEWLRLSLALFSCIVALMVMYLITTMFWAGATWVFVGLSLAATRICLATAKESVL